MLPNSATQRPCLPTGLGKETLLGMKLILALAVQTA